MKNYKLLSCFFWCTIIACSQHELPNQPEEETPIIEPEVKITCGDGITDDDEECDDGNSDAGDGCSIDCKIEQKSAITLMNWNIQFSNDTYTDTTWFDGTTYTYVRDFYGAEESAPMNERVAAMVRVINTLPEKPAIINVMEMDPSWKTKAVFGQLEALGYKMLYPNTPFMVTQLIYQHERLTLIKKGFINLTSRLSGPLPTMKTAVTYGVFQEKSTNEIFISLSPHWDTNDDIDLKHGRRGIADSLYINEMVRLTEAFESIDLVKRLQAEYPTAHVFFGGDLNTIDLNLLLDIFAQVFPGMDTSGITVATIFALLKSQYTPPDDYVGSFGIFNDRSGLINSRRYALANNLAINDLSTVDFDDYMHNEVSYDFGVSMVIDYNFFSPEMMLQSYEVLDGDDLDIISDHLPIKLELEYYIRNQELIQPISYPDDSSSDLDNSNDAASDSECSDSNSDSYVPIPEYQGHAFGI